MFKDGSLCKGYAFGGPGVQRELLETEHVLFLDETHVDLHACLWDGLGAYASETTEATLTEDRCCETASTSTATGASSRFPTGQLNNDALGSSPNVTFGQPSDELMGPPPDFDWKRELGE